MTEKIKIPFNDVFFYGISLRARDVADVRSDIFANILMRYLRTLKPVSSKLYRTSDGNKYEYSYSFIPSKPLMWRVIKNRHIIEDIEQLSDGKYCLNYYDDQGRDVKRTLFSKQHKWQKTNYYNSISGSSLLCSIVPKEVNGETAILQYITGQTYPVTLRCCPAASCQEVLINVLERVPAPDAMALTNYGLLYFAQEETLNIFNQVLQEEEEKYAQLHKPEIYTTEEDIANGFCFDVSSFDSTKTIDSMFDLSEAEELTEDGFLRTSPALQTEESPVCFEEDKKETVSQPASSSEYDIPQISNSENGYSLDADISEAIRIISDVTDVHIDKEAVFAEASVSDAEPCDDGTSEAVDVSEDEAEDTDTLSEVIISVSEHKDAPTEDEEVLDSFVILDDIPSKVQSETENAEDNLSEPAESIKSETAVVADDVDLLSMNDEDIDDYVQTLIDSLLMDAKSVAEFKDSVSDAFTAGGDEAAVDTGKEVFSTEQELVTDNPADSVIDSNGAQYFYYGDTDASGKRSGRGKTLMADGKTAYEGEYVNDMRHGVGSFYYKDGSLCYWGDWNENLRNGFGVGVSSETGTVHIGAWQHNKPTGIGVRFDKDGRFMYVDSACHKTNGGIRITAFTENSFTVEYWDENTLRTVKKEISLDDLIK